MENFLLGRDFWGFCRRVIAVGALVFVTPHFGPYVDAQSQAPVAFKHAHFSEGEVDGARHAAAAVKSVTLAATVWNPQCAALILRADVDVSRIFSGIVGGYPERPRHSDGSEVTRQHQLDAVFQHHLPRALTDSLPAALECVENMPPRPRQHLPESAQHLRDAINFLKGTPPYPRGIDTTLAYADPTPQALLTIGGVTQVEPAVVGPHGVYWDAIAQAHWMGHYSRDMLSATLPYLADLGGKRQQAINILALYREVRLWQLDSEGKIAGIVDDPADRFCSILYVGDTLTNGVETPKPALPEIYFAMMLQVMDLVAPDQVSVDADGTRGPPIRLLLQSYADMWRRTDAANWGIFRENEPLRKRCGS